MRTRRRYQPITIGTKNCNKCNIKKHVTQYSCDSKKSDGRMNICKECVSEKDKTIHYKPSEIDNLKCLQCNKIKTIDHFYNYGHTRGILCSKCNRGLGHFKDNIELLQEAINYLEGKV